MQNNTALALYQTSAADERRKRYRVQGIIMFGVATGLLLVRLLSYYLPITNETVADVVFTVPLQLGVLLVFPFLMYKFALKMNVRQIAAFSNVRRTHWYYLVLAVPLGLCVYVATIGISGMWQTFLSMLGYTHGSSGDLPETFHAGLLVLNIVLTGVLPAICEEFCNRGGFLSTMRGSFSVLHTVIIVGVAFGLFHQNITQVFYTMFFGALAAYLTLQSKSIFPAVIVHFVNNTFSVFNEFCDAYGWLGGGLNTALNWGLTYMPIVVMLSFFVVMLVGAGLVVLMLHLGSAKRLARKKEVVAESGFDHKNNRVVLVGEENKELVHELQLDKEVYGHTLRENLFRPTLADNAFYIGAAVMAVATTLFTFIFGAIV